MIRKLCTGALALLAADSALAERQINMPIGVTELSAETHQIHMIIFWWCVAIAVVYSCTPYITCVGLNIRFIQTKKDYTIFAPIFRYVVPLVLDPKVDAINITSKDGIVKIHVAISPPRNSYCYFVSTI